MKNNHFILVIFSIIMGAFMTSCDDQKMADPFAGIDVQKGVQEYPYSTTEFLNLAKMTTDRLHPLNSTETKHWKNIWFQGYIVGCYDAAVENPIQLDAPYTTNSTLLIAETPNETESTKMVLVSINIPYWQTLLGLQATNGASKNRLVKFCGDVLAAGTEQYTPIAELANLKGFFDIQDNEGFMINANPYFSESFSVAIGSTQSNFHDRHAVTSKASWKSIVANKSAIGTTTSAYAPDSLTTPPTTDESWLVSKAISIPVCDYATLSFKAKPGYWSPLNPAEESFNPSDELTFYVAELTAEEVSAGTFLDPLVVANRFTKIELTNYPTGAAETTMVKDFTSYVGKHIQIAFKYKSVIWYKFGGKVYPQSWNISTVEIK